MNDGKVPLHADHDQDEYGRRRTQTVHELVHLAEKVAKHPAGQWRGNEGEREKVEGKQNLYLCTSSRSCVSAPDYSTGGSRLDFGGQLIYFPSTTAAGSISGKRLYLGVTTPRTCCFGLSCSYSLCSIAVCGHMAGRVVFPYDVVLSSPRNQENPNILIVV